MKKTVTIYLQPITKHLDIDDRLDEREIEEEINRQVYDNLAFDLADEVTIDFWE